MTDTATPQIVKVVSTKPGYKGQVTITYGIPKTVSPPPASQVATPRTSDCDRRRVFLY